MAYLPSLNNGFTLDDAMVLTENTYTQTSDLKNILTQDTFAGFFQQKSSIDLVEGGRYRPLTLVIFSVIWPISSDPLIFHLLNVLLYALSVVIVFVMMQRLLSDSSNDLSNKILIPATTALLFAIHPIHTEVVNNVKSLDEILSLLLGLSAWLLLVRPTNHRLFTFKNIATALLFLLAMLAKETAVVLLPIIFIGFIVFKNHDFYLALKKTIPTLLGFAIYMLIRTLVLADFQPDSISTEPLNNPFLKYQDNQWVAIDTVDKAGTILYALGKYLLLLVAPVKLSHDYYPQVIPITSMTSLPAMASLIFHGLLILLCVHGIKHKKLYGFGLFIYLVSIFLFSNIPVTIGTVMAERFLYVPSLGFCLILAWLLSKLLKLNHSSPQRNRNRGSLLLTTLLIVIVGLGLLKIIDRSQDWNSNLSLFQADIAVSANSAKLQNALGGELTTQSQLLPIKGSNNELAVLEQAINHLNKAIELHPTYALAHMIKGNALHFSGQHQDAIEQYNLALKLSPEFTDAKNNLQRVELYLKTLNQQQGIQQAEEKAMLASSNGNHTEAIAIFTQLLETSQSSKHHFFRGVAYANNQQFELALKDFIQAEETDPLSDPDNVSRIYQAIKNTYVQLGQTEQADQYQLKIDAIKSVN